MKNFETNLVGCRVQLLHSHSWNGASLSTSAQGRVRAVTTDKHGTMILWLEAETEEDVHDWAGYNRAIGDVIAYPTDTGDGRFVIRVLDNADGIRKLAQDLLTSYQSFASNVDGRVDFKLEERAKACGLDTNRQD